MKKDEFRQLVREYFTFTGSERNGLILLCFILLVVIVFNQFSDLIDLNNPADQQEFLSVLSKIAVPESNKKVDELKLFTFDPNRITKEELESLRMPSQIKFNLLLYRQKGGIFHKALDFRRLYGMNDSLFEQFLPYIRMDNAPSFHELKKGKKAIREYFEFDPNLVTKEQLLKLGFTGFQSGNLIAFRNSGGKFRLKSDILKVYGMDSLIYREIKEWIKIDQLPGLSKEERVPEIVELNLADSVKLIALPGIGPVLAGRIIRYRKVLGGFSSVKQLEEIYGMNPETLQKLECLVKADISLIIPIRLNFADYALLSRHPYIDGKQAMGIINWRSAHGPFEKAEWLLDIGIFEQKTFNKLKPYLTCQ